MIMARYLYAATPADYIVNGSTGLPVPNAVVTVWTARTSGSQVTDLQNLSGQAITQVTADSSGFIAFYGPDGMTANLWIYSGSGSRLAVRAVVDPTPSGTALPLSGGTMTGALTLSGAPSNSLHAATKGYVDTNVANFVAKTGDVMSGTLRVNQASMKVSGDASTYVFERRQGDSSGYGFRLGATSSIPLSATLYDSDGSTLSAALNYSITNSRWNLAGHLHFGDLYKIKGLGTDAIANGEAVRYQQLDRPYAVGVQTGLGQSLAANAWTTVRYDSENDGYNMLNSSTGEITLPSTGMWLVNATITLQSAVSAGSFMSIYLDSDSVGSQHIVGNTVWQVTAVFRGLQSNKVYFKIYPGSSSSLGNARLAIVKLIGV